MKALRRLRYRLLQAVAARLGRQTCEDCYRDGRTAVWFGVPNETWEAVRGDRHVLCLTCFDVRAERADIDYGQDIVIEGRSSWMTGRRPWPA